MLEKKKKHLKATIANLEWHNTYGPPLNVEYKQLGIVNDVLKIIND